MKAKLIIENYPMGAKEDPNTPFNQPDGYDDVYVDVNHYGEIEIEYIDREETISIDPEKMDILFYKKGLVDPHEIENTEEYIEIQHVDDLANNNFNINTNYGNVTVSLDELESLI